MVSKNNKKNFLQKGEEKQHFGLRKLSIGVASVLLSTTVYLGISQGRILADTQINQNNESVVEKSTNNSQQNVETDNTYKLSKTENSSETGNNETQKANTEVQAVQQQSNTAEQSVVPDATNSLNAEVGQSGKINVDSYKVTQKEGDVKNPGTTNLDLGITISNKEIEKIQAGDYFDIKLGLPYNAAGHEYVMSYGAIDSNQEPIVLPYSYSGGQLTAAYIIPVNASSAYK
jgi:cytoskeletal protein RodZ